MAIRNFDVKQQFESIVRSATSAAKEIFPIKGRTRTITLERVWAEDKLSSQDFSSQAKAKTKEATWGVPVYGDLKLVENATGKVVDRNAKIRLFLLPKITDRFSYIVKGNEYQVHSQLRLKPGVYTLKKQNGELKTQVNLAKGKNFDLVFDEKKALFTIQKIGGGQANIPLYPLLAHLGMSPQAIARAWGNRIAEANHSTDTKSVDRVKAAFGVKKGTLKDYFDTTEIGKESTKIALGESFSKVDGRLLLAASKDLLQTHLGKKEPTDRDSLAYKELHSVEDFIKERLEKNKGSLAFKIRRTIDNPKRTKLSQIVNPGAFNSVVESFFTQDDKSSTPEQTNPLEMLTGQYKTTIMGTGGITQEHAVTDEMRNVHPTHYGFIDGVHTPESKRIGANLHLPIGTVKDGKDLKSVVVDKAGKTAVLSPTEAWNKKIVMPGQKGTKVKAMYQGKTITINKSAADYFTPSPSSLFSWSTNMVPFLPSNQGNRAMMASKMLEQAISLKNREAPLVQVGATPDKSMEQIVGKTLAAVAPDDGVVTKVTPDAINIRTKEGVKTVNLYNNFTLNRKSFISHESKVKVGDKVKKGQVLADNNYTKDGTLALGTNLRTAYLPYRGLNFEDGIVISESASDKLTSEHIHKKQIDIDENTILKLGAFKATYPNALTGDNLRKMDEQGVIKKGQTVKSGEALIAALRKGQVSGEVALIRKQLADRPRDISVMWPFEDDGIVTDVQKTARKITVFVKTEEKAKIGDKLSGRMGNKGIITKIIPDQEAPRDKDGKAVDLLLNPHGVISRINIGQIYESAVGKAALKAGKPEIVHNFTGENYLETTKAKMKKAKVSDKEELFDPQTGKSLGKVHVGNPHILKLFKQSTANFSARKGGPGNPYDLNLQPVKAGGEDGAKSLDLLSMYSMLSHGARANLREMSAVKSNQNDEYWKALKSGQMLPPPKEPFVYDKFMNYLKAAGIDTKKDGSKITLAPLTDKHVAEMSKMQIKDPQFYRAKDMKPVKGGFLDPVGLGGFKGDKWGHIELEEPVVNPVFENAVKKITGLGKKYDDVTGGKLFLSSKGEWNKDGKGLTGGAAIEKLLKEIDVDAQINTLTKKALKSKGATLDSTNKHLRYLKALKSSNLKPQEAYIRRKLPVIPPQYRPIYSLPDGNMTAGSANYLYQNTGVINKMMGLPVMKLMAEGEKSDLRKDLQEHVRGVSGMTDLNIKGKARDGFISEIKGGSGGQPKEGFFISKVLSKKQDYAGRSTIIPEPTLGVDDVALPERMAWKLFEPFVIRELKSHGKTPLQAMDEIKKQTSLAKKALEIVMRDRKVLLNRAPSLHKFSIMAFKPKLTEGRAIKIPPLVTDGFNADFDGDQQIGVIASFLKNDCINNLLLGISDETEKSRLSQFFEERIMTARFRETLPVCSDDGQLYIFNLEEFPHGDLIKSKEGKNGRIDFFHALPGTKIVAYDDKTGELGWQDVSGWSKHYQREIEVVTLKSGRQIVTDDDPRAVYGVASGSTKLERFTPSAALESKVWVPRVSATDLAANHSPVKRQVSYKDTTISVSNDLGYVLGSVISNGWVEKKYGERTGNIFIAAITPKVGDKFMSTCKGMFKYAGKDLDYSRSSEEAEGAGAWGASRKRGFNDKTAATLITNTLGHGADKKHLPAYFLSAPKKFREGLFAGLMDNDGSISVVKAKAKNKPQLQANYTSINLRLIQEIQLLATSLGVRSRITPAKTPAGEAFWHLSFSSPDIKKWGGKGMVHPVKLEALECEVNDKSPAQAKADMVPVPADLSAALRKTLGAKRDAEKPRKSLYVVLRKSESTGAMSRQTAYSIPDFIPAEKLDKVDGFGEWWDRIVKNTDVTWDQVVEMDKTGIREDGYDLTVPGYETFMNVDGVILSNTMTVHVPISDEANREAEGMLPSNNLYKPGTGKLMISPSQEAQVGIFYLSKSAKGRATLNKILPKKFAVKGTLDKGATKKLLQDLSKHLDNKTFAKAVAELKAKGESQAYGMGFTLGLDDLAQFSPERNKIVGAAEKSVSHAKTESDVARVNSAAQKMIDKLLDKRLKGKDNPLYDMVDSGARGGYGQLRQILVSPLMVSDPKGKTVRSVIKNSYAEGLDVGDYWTSMYGARRGMMDRALQTSLPGAFSKDIMATTIDNVISSVDCGVKTGKKFKSSSPDIKNRYLAGNQGGVAHNTLIDKSVANKLKRLREVEVRSPLTCLQAKGTCAKCYGLDEHGETPGIGDNIGAKAGQTISEPLVQLVMNCSIGNITDANGNMGAFEDFYESIDAEETYDGHCWSKHSEQVVLDSGKPVQAPIMQHHLPDDDMLFFKTKTGHTLCVQANHPLWVYDDYGCAREVLAEEVSKGDRLLVDTSVIEGEDSCPVSPYFAGRYLADGTTRYGNGTAAYKDKPVAIVITGADKDIQEATVKSISEMPDDSVKGVSYPKDVQVYKPSFADKFRNVVRGRYAADKRLCPGFNKWKAEDLEKLLAGFIDGDSSVFVKNNTTVAQVYTSSYLILQQIEVICHKLDIRFTPQVVTKEPLQKSVAFVAQLRFKNDGVYRQSVRLQRLAFLATDYSIKHEKYEPITYIKKLWTWDKPVWDVKTETRGFTCGMVRNHNTFHSGGTAGTGADAGGYKRIEQLLHLPKVVTGAAALAPIDGVVSRIQKGIAGGHDVWIGTKKVHTPHGKNLKVRVGSRVKAGDPLSEGVIKPQDLVKHKGMSAAQDYITDELHKSYHGQGVPIDRKIFETVVRSSGNSTQVLNNPKDSSYVPGDVISYTVAQHHNRNLETAMKTDDATGYKLAEKTGTLSKGTVIGAKEVTLLKALGYKEVKVMKDAIVHAPTLKGMTSIPLLRQDWMAALGYRNLAKALTEGAGQGWSTDLEGHHPIPAFARGKEFGKGKDGKY